MLWIRCNTSEGFYVNGYYTANKLSKVTTTNEDGLTVHVFSDHLGRTVLERTTDGTTVMNTYYVYDESNFTHLKWVISPEGAKSLGFRVDVTVRPRAVACGRPDTGEGLEDL